MLSSLITSASQRENLAGSPSEEHFFSCSRCLPTVRCGRPQLFGECFQYLCNPLKRRAHKIAKHSVRSGSSCFLPHLLSIQSEWEWQPACWPLPGGFGTQGKARHSDGLAASPPVLQGVRSPVGGKKKEQTSRKSTVIMQPSSASAPCPGSSWGAPPALASYLPGYMEEAPKSLAAEAGAGIQTAQG